MHWFLAALAGQCRAQGWEAAQFDPPRRASRFFRHDGALHSVRPDAFGVLRRAGRELPFFLEWERRAVRPTTMLARIAPYLRYCGTTRPLDDHGAVPLVLVVFGDALAATHFLRVAGTRCGGRGLRRRCGYPTGAPWKGWGRWRRPGSHRIAGNGPVHSPEQRGGRHDPWQAPRGLEHKLPALPPSQPGPADLCAAVECAATLHPGRMDCGGCRGAEIPVNARFCPDCGQATGFGTVPETFTPRAIRSGRSGK